MIISNCRQQIESMLPVLTNTEKKVAVYVLEHFEEIIKYNVAELAKHADVSDATIVRFCRSIGYKGFTDFKLNVAREMVPSEQRFYPTIVKDDGAEEICSKIFQANLNALNRTMLLLDMKSVEKIAERIHKAENILLFGTGGSGTVARDAQHKFIKIGVKAFAPTDVDLQLMSSVAMGSNDVAIAISFSGNNQHVISCIQNARSCGAYTVGIIGEEKSLLERYLDGVLRCAKDETIFSSESTSARIAQLTIIDALIGNVAFHDFRYYSERISRTRDATTSSKY